MDTFAKRLISVVISLFLIIYVGYQCVQAFYNPIKTETVYSYSDYETIDTDGFAVRNETLIPGSTKGYLSYTIDNGSRVSKDGKIADVFPSEADSDSQKQVDKLTQEIALLQEIQNEGDSNRANLDVIDKQIHQTIEELTTSVNSSSISGMDSWQSKLLGLMNKREITVGKATDFGARIEQLTEQKNQIASSYSKATSSITSPAAGYFINSIDGYENSIAADSVKSLTVDKLQAVMDSKPDAEKEGYIGKVVENYQWYLACIVPAADAGNLREGDSLSILLPFVSNEEIPATIAAANRDKDGDLAVIFDCSYMSSALSSIRKESVQIRLERYDGLRVPSSCVLTNDQGQQGVYVASGDTCVFRRIEILHSEPDYVICKETDQDGYLKLYDDIIVEGKGLYDGKTVR